MEDDFYIQFENKYRGSRELIKSRQKVYLPFIEPLKNFYPEHIVVDLGCGRGEWLELLEEDDWQSIGVDTNSSMVDYCKEAGFVVFQQDGAAYLRSLPSESVSVISGFHIAEHLPFNLLLELVKEAHRVLVPGGFLILETPNPENIIVGTMSFYLDPTHLHPIPAPLLSFMPEYIGFQRNKILRLQEPSGLYSDRTMTLYGVLSDVSPDYAVVAQKKAPVEILVAFDQVFEREYGVTLENLAQRYDTQVNTTSQHILKELSGIRSDITGIQTDTNGIRSDINGIRTDINTLMSERENLQAQLNEARMARDAIQAELQHVYHSRSYRITAPMRAVFGFGRVQRDRLHRLSAQKEISPGMRGLMGKIINFSRRIPIIVLLGGKIKQRFPGVWRKLATRTKKLMAEPQQDMNIGFEYSEDEVYYLNLFQSEINKRNEDKR